MKPETLSADPINPGHYKDFAVSPIDLIEAYNLGFHDGNVIKYVARADHKNGDEDRFKALWYLLKRLGLPSSQCEGYTTQIREFLKLAQELTVMQERDDS